ncbi:MAG TPA: YicC family protein [Gammaproteobacteria bacterium]|nr:YicC family protein [Gammaproteobacteria bacterium]
MIRSMTGFARKDSRQEWGSLVWEIRSLNHRYLELSTRLPEEMRALEGRVREAVGQCLSRGKVECNLRFVRHPGALCEMQLNRDQADRFTQLYSETRELLNDSNDLQPMDLLRWPGVVEESEADLTPIRELALDLLDQALQELVDNRTREGISLKEIIISRCDSIAGIVATLRDQLPGIREGLRQRLEDRIAGMDFEIDPARLEQELVIQLQKMDVDEEMDRLQTHIGEVRDVLEREEPVGRRLDFLMQELNREANTLGSKSISIDSTGASVELKVLIEQMREQIQNIE